MITKTTTLATIVNIANEKSENPRGELSNNLKQSGKIVIAAT